MKPLALVIEDDIHISEFFCFVLEDAEYKTQSAIDGQTALARLRVNTPDLIFLDLNLPDISGQEILQFIREDDRLKSTRVVIITGYGKAIDAKLEMNADFVLTKPVEYAQVHHLARRLQPTPQQST
ncbi:MAG: response regulator [Chloroflexi bacterium]|nr:MAG: response regulator [Chloroflexota bacterium]